MANARDVIISKDDPLLANLEKQDNWDGVPMHLYQGFWYPYFVLAPLLSSEKRFKARDTDVVLASQPKAGTTWMKALLFSILNRHRFPTHQSPLLTTSPHKLVESLECEYYFLLRKNPELEDIRGLYSTHLPYRHLPVSLTNSKCKIVYITRNPLDQFISEREYLLKLQIEPDYEPLPIGEAFDMFCSGVHAFGPSWDHFLGYWNARLENPDRVLFLKYEEMKTDAVSCLEKIAGFLGRPFSEEERERGLVQELLNLCSFQKLKDLQVNKRGEHFGPALGDSIYRKGEIGDWENHLTPAMALRLKKVMDEMMSGSGLKFDTFFTEI